MLAGGILLASFDPPAESRYTAIKARRQNIEKVKYDLLKWQIGGWLALAAIMAKGFGWLGF